MEWDSYRILTVVFGAITAASAVLELGLSQLKNVTLPPGLTDTILGVLGTAFVGFVLQYAAQRVSRRRTAITAEFTGISAGERNRVRVLVGRAETVFSSNATNSTSMGYAAVTVQNEVNRRLSQLSPADVAKNNAANRAVLIMGGWSGSHLPGRIFEQVRRILEGEGSVTAEEALTLLILVRDAVLDGVKVANGWVYEVRQTDSSQIEKHALDAWKAFTGAAGRVCEDLRQVGEEYKLNANDSGPSFWFPAVSELP